MSKQPDLAGIGYNDRVKLIATLGLTMPEPRTGTAVEAVLQAHLDAGGSLTPPADPAATASTVVKIPAITCLTCGKSNLHNYGSARHPRGKRRYYVCRDCGRNFNVIVETQPLSTR